MVERIPDNDRRLGLNIQAPGEDGGLEPFIGTHNAKFVGMLMAFQFRRGNARMGAVNYGTAHTVATPIASLSAQELSHYYRDLKAQAERDSEAEVLYEDMSFNRLQIEDWTEGLKSEDLSEEKRQELLINIDKSLVDLERMVEKLDRLGNA